MHYRKMIEMEKGSCFTAPLFKTVQIRWRWKCHYKINRSASINIIDNLPLPLYKPNRNMFKLFIVSTILGVAYSRPGYFGGLGGGHLSLDSGHALSGGLGGLHAGALTLDSGNSGSYSGIDSYSASHGGGGSSSGGGGGGGGGSGGDFHHGVSIVGGGGGGDGHGASFDLTNHGGHEHGGQIFGGSFVSSAKYEGGHGGNSGGLGGGLGSYGGHSYGVHEAQQYSDVLGASESAGYSLGGGGGGGGGGHDFGISSGSLGDYHY